MIMLRLAPLAAILIAAPALADPPAIASERRLSPAQIEATLAEAAARRRAVENATGQSPIDVLDPLRDDQPPLDLHGSLGVSIGTRGYRSAFGSAVLGLGGTSSVGITLHRSEGRRNSWMIP